MRRTKIIATVGPASDNDATLDALIAAGVDIVRLNFSHGTHDSHAATYARIRRAAERAGRIVAVMQDLGGPKIRTGLLEDGKPLELKTGDALRIVTGDEKGRPGQISTKFTGLAGSVHRGDRLLLADGTIELRVEASDGYAIDTTVVEGGTLGEHKGINAPGVELPASALTPKDIADLEFGLEIGVDLVALSFVRSASDLEQARSIIAKARDGYAEVPLVAKLERPEAIKRLDEILKASDAVMVARGDLGLEIPLERVPRVQKEITHAARLRHIPVIVATQVLESMTTEARPTRAEVNDAANAVDDGVDAIMLSGETAVGAHPARAVETLDAIIRDAESGPFVRPLDVSDLADHDHQRALCEAAVMLAERSDAHAIVAITRGGGTARLLSALRPRVAIIATTNREETARRLKILWGLTPLCLDLGEHPEVVAPAIATALLEHRIVPKGGLVVVVNISPDLMRQDANYLRIRRL